MRALLLALSAALLLAGCHKAPPELAAYQALGAENLDQAGAEIGRALAEHPDNAALHAARYVLSRHLALSAEPDAKSGHLNDQLAEYDWLCGHFGIKKDYGDMESGLNAQPEAAPLLQAARKALYRE